MAFSLSRQVQVLASGMMDLMTKHSAFLSLRSAMREGDLVKGAGESLGGGVFLGRSRRFLWWLFGTMKIHRNLKHHDFFDGCDGYIFHKWFWDIITWDIFCKKLRQVRTGYWCFICCPVIVVCCRGHHLGGAVLSQPIVVHVGWHVDCPGKLWERFRQRHESLFQRDLAGPP